MASDIFFTTANGAEYTEDEMRYFVFDSVVDGNCDKCDYSEDVEPDQYGMPCRETYCAGTIRSVLVEAEIM